MTGGARVSLRCALRWEDIEEAVQSVATRDQRDESNPAVRSFWHCFLKGAPSVYPAIRVHESIITFRRLLSRMSCVLVQQVVPKNGTTYAIDSIYSMCGD